MHEELDTTALSSSSRRRLNAVDAEPVRQLVSMFVFKTRNISRLGRDARVKRETIEYILKGEAQTIDFDVADRLLVAMGCVHEWHCSLAQEYEECQLAPKALIPPVEYEYTTCKACGDPIPYDPTYKRVPTTCDKICAGELKR